NPTTGRFLTLHRLKQPIILLSSTTTTLSPSSLSRALDSLRSFHSLLHSLSIPPSHLRLVATSAIRHSSNQSELINLVHQTFGFHIDVISGYDEARLTYLGVLQFHPFYHKTLLNIDIGGGSTEFVVGFQGEVKIGISLKLGHESGLIEKVKGYKIDVVVGSSGSIRMIEKAIFMGYSAGLVNEVGLMEGCRRDWKFSKGELKGLVERLCEEERGGGEGNGRKGFFKGRSGWRSVLRVASRFNNKKRMTSAAACASISQEIFTGIRIKIDVLLDDKDLEYLEAACLLHNIGLITGKKGYHKRSYHIIMNGEHLHGYNTEEVKLIALLVRHHRKKFLQLDHDSLKDFTDEMKHKFRVLCVIIRLSAILKQYQSLSIQSVQLSHSHEGFKLVFKDSSANNVESVPADVDEELRKEVQLFEKVIEQKLSIVVLSSTSGS
ncbi:hypothetical protein M8C21_031039, partial [Ambrosia artemisiifolia]